MSDLHLLSDLHQSSTLADRIDRLEAQTARLRGDASRMRLLAGLACAALVAVTAVGATAVTRSASPLAFADGSGHTRLRLDAGGVHVFDAAGKERILIGFNTKGQPAIHINDKYGTERESLYLDSTQEPTFALFDKSQNERAQFYVGNDDGSARISLDGADGSTRFYVHANDLPYLTLGDKSYNQRAYLGLTTEGSGLLRMRDTNGKEIVSIEGQTQPFVRLSEAGTERVFLGVNAGEKGHLEFENQNGYKNIILQGGDQPFMSMYDLAGNDRIDMGFYSTGAQGIQFTNSVGTLIWGSP
ncbi:MAG TPA: hypothetical protein VIG46_02030 [Candidatus Baltobacteraceae bacterium]|jgi:hypothetical protein